MGVMIIREMVGTSERSWSDAAARRATASRTVRNIREVEVVKSTATVENGEIVEYRVELKIHFEYEGESHLSPFRGYSAGGLSTRQISNAQAAGSPSLSCARAYEPAHARRKTGAPLRQEPVDLEASSIRAATTRFPKSVGSLHAQQPRSCAPDHQLKD